MPKHEELRRRSHWMIRVMEWDDPRARYPNIWAEGMPVNIQAADQLVGRLRLGDLIAIYSPASPRHAERAERFVGLSRVVGLRRADRPGHAWVDVETAHRFHPSLDLGQAPSRVFLCCDPGWPEPDVQLFRRVFDAARAAGWRPAKPELEPQTDATPTPEPEPPPEPETVETPEPAPAALSGRVFAGAHYSGDMRDPRKSTWLAVASLEGERLVVRRVEATGRSGLQAYLRDPTRALMHAEAIGLAFPFGYPLPFAESLLGGSFPEEGWWALARKLERVSWPDFLMAVQKFRDSEGEIKRVADERVRAVSPLHRVEPDMGSRSYHGIRMIAEDRSRYAIRPFETAQGKLLLEVYPYGLVQRLGIDAPAGKLPAAEAVLSALGRLDRWPLDVAGSLRRKCLDSPDALEAVIAARCAAVAVLTAEVDRTPEELAPSQGERVRCEGWIYGLQESPA